MRRLSIALVLGALLVGGCAGAPDLVASGHLTVEAPPAGGLRRVVTARRDGDRLVVDVSLHRERSAQRPMRERAVVRLIGPDGSELGSVESRVRVVRHGRFGQVDGRLRAGFERVPPPGSRIVITLVDPEAPR